MDMINKPKLVIVPGVGKNSKDLADRVKQILEEDFGLGRDVVVFSPTSAKDTKGIEPSPSFPFVSEFFSDRDAHVEAGELVLRRALEQNYVALVGYFDDPQSNYSINDSVAHMLALGNVLDHIDIPRRVLAIPYTPFLRSHSVGKYKAKGVYQADTLGIFVEHLNTAKIRRVISIMPHADRQFSQIAKWRHGIETTFYSPFHDPRSVNYLKLGRFGEKADLLHHLGPYREIIMKEYHGAYYALLDDGIETMGEEFAYRTEIPFERLLAFNKRRTGEGSVEFVGLKKWCKVEPEELKGAVVVLPDDMVSSGSSGNKMAKYLKDTYGVAKVVQMVAHPVCPDPDNMQIDAIDEVYVLNSLQHDIPKLTVIDSTPYMLAAGLYKSHSRMIERMEAEMSVGVKR